MNTYRSLQNISAVQFTGAPIPGVTCSGSPEEVAIHGCDSSRKHLPHVHTQAVGGMTVLQPSDWIYPVLGGPWAVASDAKFRGHWEVPAEMPAITETAPKTFGEQVREFFTGAPTDLPPLPPREPATIDRIPSPPGQYETKHYTDGTTASGTGPLPLTSPGGAPAVSTTVETPEK